mmetsp:Transcript_19895/g.41290  ORF Transcript_19895/g.41290 Transcript_19895/m.41290 type:complete len:515 (-) Transcript_19895:121-1665(-)
MRPPSTSLPSLEIPIGSGSAPFLGFQFVRIHGQAHGTSRLSPIESRLHQNFVESLLLGLVFDQSRSGDDHGVDSLLHFPPHGDGGDLANVFDASVGARSDEYLLNGRALDGRPALEADVLERPRHGGFAGVVVSLLVDPGDGAVDGNGVLGGRAPGDGGGDVLGVDDDRLVEDGPLVGFQTLPVVHGPVPLLSLGTHGPPLQVLEGDLVRGDDPGPRSRLDGHVRNAHARLHRQPLDGLPGELDRGARPARRADDAADVQNDVLAPHPLGQLAVDPDQHVPGLRLRQRLRGQDVLHLRRPDPERQRPERPVRGRVAVPAHRRAAREGEALLRPDDVHDALSLVLHAEVGEAEVADVLLQLQDLRAAGRLFDEAGHVHEGAAVRGGHVVVHGGEGAVRAADGAVGEAEALEGLGGGHLVDQVAVDVQEGGQAVVHDHVVVPDFVVQGSWGRREEGRAGTAGGGRGSSGRGARGETRLGRGTEGRRAADEEGGGHGGRDAKYHAGGCVGNDNQVYL